MSQARDFASNRRPFKSRRRTVRPLGFDYLEDRSVPTATINGVVFQDYNANGTLDTANSVANLGTAADAGQTVLAIDRGLGGITVQAFDSANALQGTATTAANGTYTLNAAGNAPYRIQFSTLPTGFFTGPNGTSSNTTVQFVAANGTTNNVNLGLVDPQQYSQDNPDLVTICYVVGNQQSPDPVVIGLPYNSGSASATSQLSYFQPTAHTLTIPASAVGTTWGLAYSNTSRSLFASAYFKKFSGYGPSGTGALYRINRDTGAVSVFADLNAIFGANTAGANLHAANPASGTDNGNIAWNGVGKSSLGGLDVSADGSTIYVMNLADRMLYAIPTSGPINSTTVRRTLIPLNAPGATGASGADLRPFAVQVYKGRVYVGIVNSAESTQNAADLRAYVYSVDPTTLAFDATPAFQAALNYPRGLAFARNTTERDQTALWRPWSPVFAQNFDNFILSYAQPMLSSIAFDSAGNMALGLRDRLGDQTGGDFNGFLFPPNEAEPNRSRYGTPAGDTLRAFVNTPGDVTGGWTLESNGRGPGGVGTAPQNTGQGPSGVGDPSQLGAAVNGSAEFYFQDHLAGGPSPNGNAHDETSFGSVVQIPGHPDVVSSVYDSVPAINGNFIVNVGGFNWYNNTTGAKSKGYVLYDGNAAGNNSFSKTNGIGDIVALSDPAPIELGNRVWNDVNNNGLQDAGEPGISGVTLTLVYAGPDGNFGTADDVSSSTTTNSSGLYVFNSTNVTGGVVPGGRYEIRVDKTQQALSGFALAAANQGTDRAIDSNATMVSNTAVIAITAGGAGQSDHTLDVGFNNPTPMSLGDLVWNDLNNDGLFNGAEVGITGVAVALFDAAGTTQLRTTTTDGSGNYLFANLAPGNYIVQVTPPAGFVTSTGRLGSLTGPFEPGVGPNNDVNNDDNGTATVIAGATVVRSAQVVLTLGGEPQGGGNANLTIDFGLFQPVQVCGTTFSDTDRDGTLDAGEPGVGTVTVALLDANGNPLATLTTAADGTYCFPNVIPGNYKVMVTVPTGFANTSPTMLMITVPPGGSNNNNFGFSGASLAGLVYRDDNNNGIREAAEPGIGGVVVTLTGTDANGQPVNRTVTTPADGTYIFAGLLSGTYTITETQPPQFSDGIDTLGNAGGTLGNDVFSAIPLGTGVTGTGYNFGERGTFLSGTVFVDTDRDGIQDVGENGLGGVVLTLRDSNNAIVGTQTTAADGTYRFNNLATGTYTLIETQPTGYASSTPNTLNPTVPAGGLTNQNFGETLGSLAGRVFRDDNDNGIQDGTEPGIGSVIVTLTGTDANSQPVNLMLSTAADGSFLFQNLLAGTYTLTETQPLQFNDGRDAAGSSGGNVANDVISVIVLNAGIQATGYTFGERGTFLSGTVFVDIDRDGLLDAGEQGLGGVVITLRDQNNTTTLGTATTAADGTYRFDNLVAGIYTVVETQPAGFGSSTPDTITATVPVAGLPNQNFGETGGSIAGVVYRDDNDNGAQDAGEPGIAGVSIRLTGVDSRNIPVDRTLTTAANGSFLFDGLLSGTYSLTETQPAQFADGRDTVGTSGGLVTNDLVTGIALGASVQATGYLFGERGTFLSGTVFIDANRNGILEAGEAGLGGVVITLQSGGQNVGTATTAADGTYRFNNLAAGTYTVVETQPPAFGSTTPNTLNVNVPVAGLPNQNFGETAGSLAGRVYRDDNNNGTPDAGEPGIGGVALTLTGTDANGQPVNRSTTTAADGTYSFTVLPQGTYTVTETQPAQFADGTDTAGTAGGTAGNDVLSNIPLGAAVDATGYNFGERGAALSGVVYVDANNNGIRDAGEPGIPGVTVTLRDANNVVVGSTTTAADGSYQFTNLPSGNYTIVETQPAGYASSTPNSLPVTLTPAGLTNQNFGEITGSIAGRVYRDDNGNGVQDIGEPGIAGVSLALSGSDVNGAPVNRTTTTAADGTYLFTGLLQGTYTINETQPVGFNDGSDSLGNSGGTLGNDVVSNIPLATGFAATGYNFGEVGTGLSGVVFVDLNGNGVRDGGEAGLPGVAITVRDSNGNVQGTTTTGPDGSYAFNNLLPGNYTVVETQPNGYGSSTPNTLNVTVPLTGLGNVNFGETVSSISGRVYRDDNGNGVPDAGEPGINGVTVALTGTDANGAAINRSLATGADGSFAFTGLLSGTYTLTETQPANFLDGADAAGSAGGTVGNDVISAIALPPGTAAINYVFGERPPALPSVTGVVYVDANSNGIRDGGEVGLGGVALTLRDATGAIVGTTTTAPDGSYRFDNVTPGNYSIVEGQPNGYGSSTPNTLNVAVPTNGLTNQNFGETLASIAGRVFRDDNDNGTQDANEPGIAGVTVTLTGNDVLGGVVNRAATTAADGSYSFTGLIGGTYTVTETQPAGFTDGQDRAGTAGGLVGSDTVSAIQLGGGIAATGYTFGERIVLQTTLSGLVYVDLNGNGIRELNENGLPGVLITLRDVNNNVVGTTTTGNDGTYAFTVTPGSYTLVETQPAGYGSSTPNTLNVSVPPAGLNDQNFGETPASISGIVYRDDNNNGTPDAGEPGIAGATVTLTGTDANGLTVNRAATTASDGTYSFTGLLSGTYTVTETQPAGFDDGQDRAGTAGGTVSNDVVSAIGLGVAVTATGYNFGERTPVQPTTVAGVVYLDANGNGVRDAGETGLPGVVVTLRDGANNVVGTATTGADGSYLITNVIPGSYTLTETQPNGYGSSTTNTLTITVPVGGLTNQNYGETTSTLSGSVFRDDNNNGTQNAGEPGIGGATITLAGTDANGQTVNRTTTTAADGTYSFSGLLSGTYTITETQPSGFVDGQDRAGATGGTVGNDVISAIPLGAGVAAPGYTFGELAANSSLAGAVFRDDNNNGTQDAGEPGIGGATLTLTGTDANGQTVNRTATTAADGTYSFAGLLSGTYTVTETQPAGFDDGQDRAGSVGGTVGNDVVSAIVLPANTAATGYTFGERAPVVNANVSGVVYLDGNRSGVQDPGEAGIGGVLITLRDAGGNVVGTTTTGGDGSYLFRVPPWTYQIVETQPAGLTRTTPDVLNVAVPVGGIAGQNFGEVAPTPPNPQVVSKGQLLANNVGTGTGTPARDFTPFVTELYRDVLQRTGAPAEVAAYVARLQAGEPAKNVARAFWTSAEHRGIQVDNFYRQFLGRDADAAGRAGFVNMLLTGAREENLILAFLTSAEYAARHPGDAAFLAAVFSDVLGRPIDAGAQAFFLPLLARPNGRVDVVRSILNSQECYEKLVGDYFRLFLNRPADAAGLGYWTGRLRAGVSFGEVAWCILATGENGA